MNYGDGDHKTADYGYMWLYGYRPKSRNVDCTLFCDECAAACVTFVALCW